MTVPHFSLSKKYQIRGGVLGNDSAVVGTTSGRQSAGAFRFYLRLNLSSKPIMLRATDGRPYGKVLRSDTSP